MKITKSIGELFGGEVTIIECDSEPGDPVLCDTCGKDYTDSEEKGGILFGSKAVCPSCTERMMPDIKKFKEEYYIKGECPENMSFRDWVWFLRKNM